jgi:hypothetical protein
MKNLLLYLLLIFTCYSCCPKEYDELNKDELSWLPYEVGDTLYFKSNLGNTDKWVVRKRDLYEVSYGEGHTNCINIHYHALHFDIYYEREQLTFEMGIQRDKKNGDPIIYVEPPGYISQVKYISVSDSIVFETEPHLSGIITYTIKKGFGLNKYVLKDSVEVYEKM